MMTLRTIALLLAVTAAPALVVACGGTVEHSPQTAATAATKAPLTTDAHGIVKVVSDALGDVALRPDQRTEIEKLIQDAEARRAPMVGHAKEIMASFADQIEKGSIDKTALQPKLDGLASEIDKIRTDDRTSLVKLHDLLDSEQRNAFVDALEQRLEAAKSEHGDKMQNFRKLKLFGDELQLTDIQKSQIHDVMREGFKERMTMRANGTNPAPQPEQGRKGHAGHGGKKFMEAFRADKLDLDQVPQRDTKAMVGVGSGHMIGFAEKIVPILTPEQRKIAADKLRNAGTMGEGGFFLH